MAKRPPVDSELYPDDFPARFLPHVRLAYTPVESGIPLGAWRSTLHSSNAFAVQSFVDELAHAQDRDPLEFRLELIGPSRRLDYAGHGGPVFDTGRLAGVLRLAAERAGWSRPLEAGRARGIAGHFTFGSYAAHVVEVSRDPAGSIRVDRDRGRGRLRAGREPEWRRGAGAGWHAGGSRRRAQRRDHRPGRTHRSEQLRRLPSAPAPRGAEVEVHFVPSEEPPSGLGETAVPPVAPALANAVFALTGERVRRLPMAEALRERSGREPQRPASHPERSEGGMIRVMPPSLLSYPSYSPSLIRSTRRVCARALYTRRLTMLPGFCAEIAFRRSAGERTGVPSTSRMMSGPP